MSLESRRYTRARRAGPYGSRTTPTAGKRVDAAVTEQRCVGRVDDRVGTVELRGVRIDRDGSSLVPIIDESAPPVAF